jgi:hypothetical protein
MIKGLTEQQEAFVLELIRFDREHQDIETKYRACAYLQQAAMLLTGNELSVGVVPRILEIIDPSYEHAAELTSAKKYDA